MSRFLKKCPLHLHENCQLRLPSPKSYTNSFYGFLETWVQTKDKDGREIVLLLFIWLKIVFLSLILIFQKFPSRTESAYTIALNLNLRISIHGSTYSSCHF